jgi:hypothetical protein
MSLPLTWSSLCAKNHEVSLRRARIPRAVMLIGRPADVPSAAITTAVDLVLRP